MKVFLIQLIIIVISLPSVYSTEVLNDTVLNSVSVNNIQPYNTYRVDGNISIMVALDSSLLGEGKYFVNYSVTKTYFELWLRPLETKFHIKFHISNVTKYEPGDKDSLFTTMNKVTDSLDWKLASSIEDDDNNGNGYDILVIYQKEYNGGRNHVNALFGNALIIAHDQPLNWVSHQLILIHEVCHLFGAAHDENGEVPSEWYGSAERSVMSYSDLTSMTYTGFDKNNIPIDDRNFKVINNSRYRFDNVDSDGDGIQNWYENKFNLDPNLNDSYLDEDGDSLTNLQEFILGTHPYLFDSDFDGYSDWFEYKFNSDALNSSINLRDIDPIILQLNNITILPEGEELTLQWLTASYDPKNYIILSNGSVVFEDMWREELIEYDVELMGGVWNYTCVIYNSEGKSSSSSVVINVIEQQKSEYSSLAFSVSLITIVLLLRKHRRD